MVQYPTIFDREILQKEQTNLYGVRSSAIKGCLQNILTGEPLDYMGVYNIAAFASCDQVWSTNIDGDGREFRNSIDMRCDSSYVSALVSHHARVCLFYYGLVVRLPVICSVGILMAYNLQHLSKYHAAGYLSHTLPSSGLGLCKIVLLSLIYAAMRCNLPTFCSVMLVC